MEDGPPGQSGAYATIMGRFRGIGAAPILNLYLGLLVREKTNRKRTVVSVTHLSSANEN